MFIYRLRKQVKIILWIVVIGFVGWIFFELGADIIGYRITKPWERGVLGEVGKYKITIETYNEIFNQIYNDSLKAKGKTELTEQEINAIERQAWERILELIRLDALKSKRNINLSDDAILTVMQFYPPRELLEDTLFYDTLGNFDLRKYQAALRDPRNMIFFAQYEKRLRTDLVYELLKADFLVGPTPSSQELLDKFYQENTYVKLQYARIYPHLVNDTLVSISDKEIVEYYNKNKKTKYKQKERINIAFVTIPKAPSREDSLEAKNRLLNALNELKQGKNWKEVVEFYSDETINKEKEGLIGSYHKQFVPFIYQPLLDTLIGREFSDIILTPGGFEILKIEPFHKDSVRIKRILATINMSQKTKENLRLKAENFVKLAREIGFDSAAKNMGLEVRETKPFPRDFQFIPLLGKIDELEDFVLKGRKKEIKGPIRRPNDYVVLNIKEVLKEVIPPFEEVRNQVRYDLLQEKKRDYAKRLSQEIYEKWKRGEMDFEKFLAQGFGNFVVLTDTYEIYIGRQAIPGIPQNTSPYGVIFYANSTGVLPPIEDLASFIIINLMEKRTPNERDFSQEKPWSQRRTKNQWTQAIWFYWNHEAKSNQGVKDYRNYIY